jgi:hypothetical protein
MEAGEDAAAAAVRETIEECGSGIGSVQVLGLCQTVPAGMRANEKWCGFLLPIVLDYANASILLVLPFLVMFLYRRMRANAPPAMHLDCSLTVCISLTLLTTKVDLCLTSHMNCTLQPCFLWQLLARE